MLIFFNNYNPAEKISILEMLSVNKILNLHTNNNQLLHQDRVLIRGMSNNN